MNKTERFIIGIYRALNEHVYSMGGLSWQYDLAYWVLLGWVSCFGIVEKTAEGVQFRADLWDTKNVYPEWDDSGMKRCVRAYEVDEAVAKELAHKWQSKGLKFQYQKPKDGFKSEVVNYWLRTMDGDTPKIWNGILLNGVLAKPITLQKNLRRIPIHVGAIGSPDRTSPGWEERQGESVLYANRDMIDYRNKMISLYAEIVAETAYPNVVTKTRTGQPPFREGELKGHGSEINLKLEDQIELLKHAATPQEAAVLLTWLGQRLSEGFFPPPVYGMSQYDQSGFAISQLLAAVQNRIGANVKLMEMSISYIIMDLLYQYKAGKFPKVTLSTTDPHSLKRGMFYLEDFSHDDIPDRTYVETKIPLATQFDKTQQILNAKQALTPPQIYSLETIWEMDDQIQDFDVEWERIVQDRVRQDPFVISMDIVSGLWERYEALKANPNTQQAAEALKKYILIKEMQIGMRQGIPVSPNGGQSISPNQMPPEMTMSPNPDQARAMQGQPPPSGDKTAQNKPQGMLYSPSGEVLL